MRIRQRGSGVFQSLRRHKLMSGTAIATALGFVWNLFNDYQTGTSLMEGWLGKDWLAIAVHSPWFTVIALAIIVGCLWRIGTLAEGDRGAEAQEVRRIAERASSISAQQLLPLAQILQGSIAEMEFRKIPEKYAAFANAIGRHKAAIDSLEGNGPTTWPAMGGDALNTSLDAVIQQLRELEAALCLELPSLHLTKEKPVTTVQQGHRTSHAFDPAVNHLYFSHHRADLDRVSKQSEEIQTHINTRLADLKSDQGSLEGRLKAWIETLKKDSTAF